MTRDETHTVERRQLQRETDMAACTGAVVAALALAQHVVGSDTLVHRLSAAYVEAVALERRTLEGAESSCPTRVPQISDNHG